ncbi:zinc finger, CCHC-type containing protein [Tanacetum coccineum]
MNVHESEMMILGTPTGRSISLMYNLVMVSILSVSRVGMKCADLIVPAFLKELIYKVLGLQVSLLELDRFEILLDEREEGQAMAKEDAFLVDDVEGGLCVDNTDAEIDGRFNSGSNKDKGKLWDSLESKYMAEDSSSKKFLISNFNNYKMVDSRPVMEQYNELLRILGQYTQHGLKMDESISVSSIIDKLPPSWKDFKHTLKHDSDKGKGKEVARPSVNMAEEGKNKNNKQNKGKKRDFKEHGSGSGSNKKPKLECWKCGKTGHFKRDCRSGNKKNANAGGSGKGSKDHSQDQGQNLVPVWNRFIKYSVSLISEAFYVQVDAIAWWIDSGATTHVCKDRCWFKTYEPVEDGSVLYMGDDHFAPVHGKGSVVLEFSSGKSITLFNVLYVPKLRKNLISGPVLNKCGYKQVYESDKFCYVYLLHAKDEALDKFRISKTEVELQQNDLIKTLRTDIGGEYYDPVFFQSIGIIHETITLYTPLQNGVAERKNIALKEIVNSMLSYLGLSEGFGGEAMLTACYLLNRACRAVVRLPDPKRKPLGEKGIDCIFVGYAEHSKVYRFYVIEPNDSVSINSIIESRDAIFDENRFSSIPKPKDIMPNSVESQRDDHSDDVPSEIPKPRKGKRVRKAKSYDYDFQLYLVEGSRDHVGSQYSYCYSIEEDPRTYDEAMQSRDAAF